MKRVIIKVKIEGGDDFDWFVQLSFFLLSVCLSIICNGEFGMWIYRYVGYKGKKCSKVRREGEERREKKRKRKGKRVG